MGTAPSDRGYHGPRTVRAPTWQVENALREELRAPGVQIVLKGGPWTLFSVKQQLDRDCPAVLVASTRA